MLQKLSSFQDLERRLSTLVSPDFINTLGHLLVQSLSAADALGRSYVVNKEKHFSDENKVLSAKLLVGKYFVRANDLNWIVADDSSVKISWDLTPLNALSYFTRKAFFISGIENQKFIDEIKFQLERALAEGLTYDQFAAQFQDLYLNYGIAAENPIRLQTIFRTNLFTSYTAGQLKQVNQVKNQFPIWRCIGVKDSRQNLDHEIITDKYFKSGPYPPIWFGCRHTAQFIHVFQAEQISESEIYESVYDLVDESKVIDFLGTGAGENMGVDSFDRWVSDNPVSEDVQRVINAGVV